MVIACSSEQEPVSQSTEAKDKQTTAVSDYSNDPPWRRMGETRLKSQATTADLNRIANDGSAIREKRAEAIFSLFANHVKIPGTASEVGKVFGSEKWMKDASLTQVTYIGGYVPLELNLEDAIFCLGLFPDKDGWSDWVIYFRLSGGVTPSADETGAFLRGAAAVRGSPKLVEFALCYPLVGEKSLARTERFSEKGVMIEEIEWRPGN